MRYWLMKTEPQECSVDDMLRAPARRTPWTGVRNYQARNFMRDDMREGDGVLLYHSSCPEPGIAGIGEVASAAYPDATQFDPASAYYDPKSAPGAPRWFAVDVRVLKKTRLVALAELRAERRLAGLWILRPGNRLSVTPVSAAQWRYVTGRLA